jgi:cytidylate kinase
MDENGRTLPVVAIDGPAASGKSTVATIVAERLGFPFISTGAMYRAVTLCLLETRFPYETSDQTAILEFLAKLDLDYHYSAEGVPALSINGIIPGDRLRSPDVTGAVSRVSAIPEVRSWLVERQRALAEGHFGIVMEGRDIGTVVFPDAKFKFFLTATPEVRARRRLAQSGEIPAGVDVERVARDIAERDRLDMTRSISPLKKADDALLIDSSSLTIDEVVETILETVKGRGEPQ